MNLKIAVLAGDGIGPEIMEQGVAVMDAVAKKFGHEVSYKVTRRLSVALTLSTRWVIHSQRRLSRFVRRLMQFSSLQ